MQKRKQTDSDDSQRKKMQMRRSKVDPDNFSTANNTVFQFNRGKPQRERVELEDNGYYAFLEQWQSRDCAQESASGFAHIRLIVGQYMCKEEKAFNGYAYDLVKPAENMPIAQKIYRCPWEPNVERFGANHYYKEAKLEVPGDKNGWLSVSRANTYANGGKVKSEILEGQKTEKDVLRYLKDQGE